MQTNNINEAIAARDAGMQLAEDHAEAVHNGWKQDAFNFLVAYARTTSQPFLCEDVRAYAEENGLPQPPHARAYGGIFRRAAVAGIIERVGIGPVKNVNAHRANASIWKPKNLAA